MRQVVIHEKVQAQIVQQESFVNIDIVINLGYIVDALACLSIPYFIMTMETKGKQSLNLPM